MSFDTQQLRHVGKILYWLTQLSGLCFLPGDCALRSGCWMSHHSHTVEGSGCHAKVRCGHSTISVKQHATQPSGRVARLQARHSTAECKTQPQIPQGPQANLIKSLFFLTLDKRRSSSMRHWQLIGLGRATSSFVSIVLGLPRRSRTIDVPKDGL